MKMVEDLTYTSVKQVSGGEEAVMIEVTLGSQSFDAWHESKKKCRLNLAIIPFNRKVYGLCNNPVRIRGYVDAQIQIGNRSSFTERIQVLDRNEQTLTPWHRHCIWTVQCTGNFPENNGSCMGRSAEMPKLCWRYLQLFSNPPGIFGNLESVFQRVDKTGISSARTNANWSTNLSNFGAHNF